MFNAAFIIKYNESLTEEQQAAYLAEVEALCAEIDAVHIVRPLLEGSVPAYNLYAEIGFKDQDAFEAAKQLDAFKSLRAKVDDPAQTAGCEYAAFGSTLENFSDRESKCHRLLLFHAYPDTAEELKTRMEETIVRFPDYVPAMVNCKIARVVEASGSMDWNYAFDVDFEQPSDYFGWYLHTPYHWGFIDRYFEPSSCDFFIDPHLCSVYCPADEAFLSHYRE